MRTSTTEIVKPKKKRGVKLNYRVDRWIKAAIGSFSRATDIFNNNRNSEASKENSLMLLAHSFELLLKACIANKTTTSVNGLRSLVYACLNSPRVYRGIICSCPSVLSQNVESIGVELECPNDALHNRDQVVKLKCTADINEYGKAKKCGRVNPAVRLQTDHHFTCYHCNSDNVYEPLCKSCTGRLEIRMKSLKCSDCGINKRLPQKPIASLLSADEAMFILVVQGIRNGAQHDVANVDDQVLDYLIKQVKPVFERLVRTIKRGWRADKSFTPQLHEQTLSIGAAVANSFANLPKRGSKRNGFSGEAARAKLSVFSSIEKEMTSWDYLADGEGANRVILYRLASIAEDQKKPKAEVFLTKLKRGKGGWLLDWRSFFPSVASIGRDADNGLLQVKSISQTEDYPYETSTFVTKLVEAGLIKNRKGFNSIVKASTRIKGGIYSFTSTTFSKRSRDNKYDRKDTHFYSEPAFKVISTAITEYGLEKILAEATLTIAWKKRTRLITEYGLEKILAEATLKDGNVDSLLFPPNLYKEKPE